MYVGMRGDLHLVYISVLWFWLQMEVCEQILVKLPVIYHENL
jgi:hypothetical protein